MEDDDDAFLYGDDEPQGGAERANAEKGTKEADDGAQEAASKDAEEQDNEGDDDEDDDEDSDSVSGRRGCYAVRFSHPGIHRTWKSSLKAVLGLRLPLGTTPA